MKLSEIIISNIEELSTGKKVGIGAGIGAAGLGTHQAIKGYKVGKKLFQGADADPALHKLTTALGGATGAGIGALGGAGAVGAGLAAKKLYQKLKAKKK
jgi:hypothetical protein